MPSIGERSAFWVGGRTRPSTDRSTWQRCTRTSCVSCSSASQISGIEPRTIDAVVAQFSRPLCVMYEASRMHLGPLAGSARPCARNGLDAAPAVGCCCGTEPGVTVESRLHSIGISKSMGTSRLSPTPFTLVGGIGSSVLCSTKRMVDVDAASGIATALAV